MECQAIGKQKAPLSDGAFFELGDRPMRCEHSTMCCQYVQLLHGLHLHQLDFWNRYDGVAFRCHGKVLTVGDDSGAVAV